MPTKVSRFLRPIVAGAASLAAMAACASGLKDCLPLEPRPARGCEGEPHGDGRPGHGPEACDASAPPEPLDATPGDRPDGHGEGPGGGEGHGGGRGHHGPPPPLDGGAPPAPLDASAPNGPP